MITKKGTVTKISGAKTVRVEISESRAHPKYKKRFRITRNFLAHDEKEIAKVGEIVVIEQHRPISKLKSWIVVPEINNAKTK
jgi:small subunit ribosomal protein S17